MNIMDELINEYGVYSTQKAEPFVIAYNSFLQNKNYDMKQKSVFLLLKSYCGIKIDCFPSQKTLAEQLGVTIKTVKKVLDELVKLGGLLVINRITESNRKTSNLYILADIDIKTGDFIPSSLDKFRPLAEEGIRVKGN
ncbi:MAG: helix-turn-helix domain-containing protein [Clostridium sp.]|uniref:helix-turn-helix domain-containing protein n=1 Tax=Clostridium sp. TaxID=1506 RepID=UPI00257D96D4|nr:helix-turn-helix domain-containing protein [Clostridium sp.]MBS4841112.1 helix-turn-helix domain-containing protein [Clostridium sp.]